MNIYEYQAKKIFKKFGIKIPEGYIAYTPNEAVEVAEKISGKGPWVVKAQIMAGSRDRGIFIDKRAGDRGGIRLSKTLKQVYSNADEMLENKLITNQTSDDGIVVSRVYIEQYVNVIEKFYFGLVIDRVTATIVLLISRSEPENDDIVQTAINQPDKILRLDLGVDRTIKSSQIKRILEFMAVDVNERELKSFINKMLKIFYSYDAVLLEINPIGITKNGEIYALDAKILFDNNALYRHKDIFKLNDDSQTNERVLTAKKFGFHYKELESGIGIIVNGDGIAANTIYEAKKIGLNTACFLNLKGGIDRETITASIKLIITNPKVDGIFINIIGGFSRCNLIADGIINVSNDLGLNIPLVVRFEGTNKQEATDILQKSDILLSIAEDTPQGLVVLKKAIEEDL